jgi:Ni/Co efflux regulator RcnB
MSRMIAAARSGTNSERRISGACGVYGFAVLVACLMAYPAWAGDPDRIQLAQFCPPGPMYGFCINQYQQQQRMLQMERQEQQQEMMRQQQIQMQQQQMEMQRQQQMEQQRQAAQQHRMPQMQNAPVQNYRPGAVAGRAPGSGRPVQQPYRNASAPTYSYNGQVFQPFNASPYQWPRGVKPRRFKTGDLLPRTLRVLDYVLSNWPDFGLDDPGPDYEWIRCGTDLLLIDPNDGEVMDAAYNAFVDTGDGTTE